MVKTGQGTFDYMAKIFGMKMKWNVIELIYTKKEDVLIRIY